MGGWVGGRGGGHYSATVREMGVTKAWGEEGEEGGGFISRVTLPPPPPSPSLPLPPAPCRQRSGEMGVVTMP